MPACGRKAIPFRPGLSRGGLVELGVAVIESEPARQKRLRRAPYGTLMQTM
jgi:hypothetical protein